MRATAIESVNVKLLKVSARSHWILVEVRASDGSSGLGEASLHFSEREVLAAARALGAALIGASLRTAFARIEASVRSDLVTTSALCALDQALTELEARRLGVPISRLYRASPARELEVYANINRRTRVRSPEGFAASARDAVAAGFSALKIAPFDDVAPDLPFQTAAPLLDAGFARIAAVRAVIGARRLLVDCHWRLSDDMLGPVLDACAAHDVFWLETPFPEDEARIGAIRSARAKANGLGIRTAGCELKIGRAQFAPFIAAGAYDIVMPDMKYVGGYGEFIAVAAAAQAAGVAVSPHNPTGPICHAHSVQVSAAVEPFLILEMQFDETPAFRAIVEGDLPMPLDGRVRVPGAPGTGLALRDEAVELLEVA
jgi:galactonate dehydratase